MIHRYILENKIQINSSWIHKSIFIYIFAIWQSHFIYQLLVKTTRIFPTINKKIIYIAWRYNHKSQIYWVHNVIKSIYYSNKLLHCWRPIFHICIFYLFRYILCNFQTKDKHVVACIYYILKTYLFEN